MQASIRPGVYGFCSWRRDFVPLLFANGLISLFLTLIDDKTTFASNLIISNCIGLSIWLCSGALSYFTDHQISWPIRMLLSLPIGVIVGFKLAAVFGAYDVIQVLMQQPHLAWRWVAISVFISCSAMAFFIVLFHAQRYKAELETERRLAAEAQQGETAAQLAMLQAQIEPHFLFNTLANLRSLMCDDPQLALAMLDHLNDYLRASLKRTRMAKTSLHDELELVSALLAINQIRLGERLHYQIDIMEACRRAILPPLLLQPLVENALKHGIEPAIAGGHIHIVGEIIGSQLCIRVIDSGLGLKEHGEHGIGLANVRARLASLYGDQGELALYPNSPHGVIAELKLPFQTE